MRGSDLDISNAQSDVHGSPTKRRVKAGTMDIDGEEISEDLTVPPRIIHVFTKLD